MRLLLSSIAASLLLSTVSVSAETLFDNKNWLVVREVSEEGNRFCGAVISPLNDSMAMGIYHFDNGLNNIQLFFDGAELSGVTNFSATLVIDENSSWLLSNGVGSEQAIYFTVNQNDPLYVEMMDNIGAGQTMKFVDSDWRTMWELPLVGAEASIDAFRTCSLNLHPLPNG